MVEGFCCRVSYPSTSSAGSPPQQSMGRNMAPACVAQPHALGAVRLAPAGWRRLGRVPAGAARLLEAFAVGAGSDGHSRKRTSPPAGPPHPGPHPCRGARCKGRAMGDGGRGKMLLPLGRDRRNLGRPQSARLYRDEATGRGVGAKRHALLARAPGRNGEPQRRANAVANRERTVIAQRSRLESAGSARMGCRAVPRARNATGAVGRDS